MTESGYSHFPDCLQSRNIWVGTFKHEADSLFPSRAQISFLRTVQFCGSWKPLGIVNGRSSAGRGWTVAPQFTKWNNTNNNAPTCGRMEEAERWIGASGQSGEQKRTTIDYYIKQNEIVSRWKEGKSLTRRVQLSGKMISHLQCVLDCNLRGKIVGEFDVGWKVSGWSLGELEYTDFLPASWSLSISWSPGLVSPALIFISPSPKKDNKGKTRRWIQSVYISESSQVLSFQIYTYIWVWFLARRGIPGLPACFCYLWGHHIRIFWLDCFGYPRRQGSVHNRSK